MRQGLRKSAVLVSTALALVAAGCTSGEGGTGGTDESTGGGRTLKQVQDRGQLVCGVNDENPGFGFVAESGDPEGFDIDFCKAVAAAVLGDPAKVEYKVLTNEQRLVALQGGEIDVLIRNTTWTSGRDGSDGATFLTPTFYDGQGMMVRADSEYETLEDMEGTTICVLTGSTTELNLESAFKSRGLSYEPLPFEENELIQPAFIEERCDGWTSDKSQLAGVRANWPEGQGGPEALRILDEVFSKEPLTPAVRDGDSRWAQIVDWVVLATIQAEEFGVTSSNVDQMKNSDDPEVARFLGEEEGKVFDPGLGLPPDFAVKVIEAVGNYGEIYDRNVGPDTALGLERGVNDLWTEGGLLYAPPYR